MVELAPVILEAEKSNNLPSASRVPGKPGLFHSKPEGPRGRGTDGMSPGPSVRAGECASSGSQAERMNSPCLHVVPFIPSTDWIIPAHIWRAIFLRH